MSAFRVTPGQGCRTARKSAPLRRAHHGAVLSGSEGARRLQRGRLAPTLPFTRMRRRGGGWQTFMIFGVELWASSGATSCRRIAEKLPVWALRPQPVPAVEEHPPQRLPSPRVLAHPWRALLFLRGWVSPALEVSQPFSQPVRPMPVGSVLTPPSGTYAGAQKVHIETLL